MTFREKLRREHPELRSTSVMAVGCPHHYGYETKDGCSVYDGKACSCAECWDREIPGTENIKKENDIMPVNAINADTRKMTKADMIKEIEYAHNHIREMESQLKNLERYKQYENAADELKALHTAFMNSGFTNEQAFDLLKTITQATVPAALRGMCL